MTRDEWNALAERCENATGPDRALDRLIALACGWQRFTPSQVRRGTPGWIAPEDYIGRRSDGSPILDSLHGTTINRNPPAFTASLDAITALIEREFPGCGLSVKSRLATVKTVARLFLRTGMISSEDAATLPLALCAAFARAMASKETA